MPDYLPRRDADLVQWTGRLGRTLSADPLRYELAPEQVATYVELQQSFSDAYALTQNASSDSTRATTEKNEIRQRLKDQTRTFVRFIRSKFPGSATLNDLGLRPRKARSRVTGPTVAPDVQVIALRGRFATIQLSDPATPSRRGMPRHVPRANVMVCIKGDATPPQAGDVWKLAKVTGRARCALVLPVDPMDGEDGRRVWLSAHWSRGMYDTSPASSPICLNHWHRIMPMPSVLQRRAA